MYMAASSASGVKLLVSLKTFNFNSEGDENPVSATYYWLLSWPDVEAVKSDFWTFSAPPQQRLDFALEKVSDFHPDLTEIIRSTKAENMLPSFPIRDVLLPSDRLASTPQVRATVIGDAAHAMAPYRGQGANEAIRDAIELSDDIGREFKSSGVIGAEVLRKFEEKTRERQESIVKLSRESALSNELALPPAGPPGGGPRGGGPSSGTTR
jgi:2-polyprenyl-6-methoxyphenol hydroxylase-like FAD-dependent oxidoreductase